MGFCLLGLSVLIVFVWCCRVVFVVCRLMVWFSVGCLFGLRWFALPVFLG